LVKFIKNNINLLITTFLISFFSFFVTFNKFHGLSTNNKLFLIIPLLTILLSVTSYLMLVAIIPLNIKVIKKFYFEKRKLLLSFFALIILYIVNYFLINTETESSSALLNFLFNNYKVSNFFFKNFNIFFLIIFIFNIFLICQLKIPEKNIFNILLQFSLFFLILAIFQNIIFFLDSGSLISKYITDINNCIYFQFLPFGVSGKRNYEIIPFIIGYILTIGFNKNKYIFLNLLFFVACFLTYSKNLWVTLVIINLISFFILDKIRFLKNLFLKLSILIISIFLLAITTPLKNNCEPKIINYTIVKIISLLNIFENDKLTSIKEENIKKLTAFKNYVDNTLNEKEFVATTNHLLDSTVPRKNIYKESLKKISEKIMFGYGPNNYILKSNNSNNSESEFLKILLDLGVIGIFVWIYFFVQLFKECKSKWSFLILLSIISLSLFNIYSWFLPIYFIVTCIIFFEKNVRSKSIL
jgi:O-antigen ligase